MKQAAFVRDFWATYGRLTQFDRSGRMDKGVSLDLRPQAVNDELDAETTTGEILSWCLKPEMVQECFDRLVSGLPQHWILFGPVLKTEIADVIRRHGLEDRFDPAMLSLSEAEKRTLRIRWDVSDMLYADAKKGALERCRAAGLDFADERFDFSYNPYPTVMRTCRPIVVACLKSRLDFDLAAVAFAAPNDIDHHREEVEGRLRREYFWFLERTRRMLRELDAALHPRRPAGCDGFEDLPRDPRDSIVSAVERELHATLKSDYETEFAGVSSAMPSTVAYRQVRRLAREPTEVNVSEHINVQGNIGVFVNKPVDTVIRDFRNSFMGEDPGKDEVNAQLMELVKLLLESRDLPADAKEEAVEAVHSVAGQVKEGKAARLTLKGALEAIRGVVSDAADIAVPAGMIITTVLKLVGA